jgi:hypothetical protein
VAYYNPQAEGEATFSENSWGAKGGALVQIANDNALVNVALAAALQSERICTCSLV